MLSYNALLFGMGAMLFLFNGTLLFQGNLPRVLLVIFYNMMQQEEKEKKNINSIYFLNKYNHAINI